MRSIPRSLVAVVLLLCGPASRGESLPDAPTNHLSKLIAQLSAATSNASQWLVVTNSPEEGFVAGVLNQADNTALFMLCLPDEDEGEPLRGIMIAWNGRTTVLGSHYDHLDEIPVSFRWSDDVNQANLSNWYKFVDEEEDTSGVLGLNGAVTNVLDRVVETSGVSVAVRKAPVTIAVVGASYARTRFAWSNNPPVEGMEDCGHGQIEDPDTPGGDGFECSYTDKSDGGFILDCSPRP